MASQQPCLSCACTNPRLLSDVLGAIHIKRGQTTLCTATPALGLQFAVEVSSCLRAKVTLKSEMFSSLRLQRDVRFKVNLTSLLDCLNVFSHSLVRDNPLEIEYSRGEAMQLRLTEADHEACCTVQTVEEADDAEDLHMGAVTNKVIIESEALRDALAEIDWSNPSATVSLGAQSLVITVDSTSGFSYEVKFPKEAPIFTEYECTNTQTNSYNLSQLRQCFKALALSVPSNTSVRMDGADLLSLQTAHCGRDGSVMAFIEYVFCPTSGSDATMD